MDRQKIIAAVLLIGVAVLFFMMLVAFIEQVFPTIPDWGARENK